MGRDSDTAETGRAIDEHNKEVRKKNLAGAYMVLGELGVEFKQFTPYHIRVKGIDFWPSSGKFQGKGIKGRGLWKFLKIIDAKGGV